MFRPSLTILTTLVLSSIGNAQITTTGPFTGTYTEEFEHLLNYPWPQCIPGRIFDNHADACTPSGNYCVDTFGWLLYCAIYPHNGSNGLFGSAQGPVDYTFDTPAQRFGGYFGTNGYLAGGHAEFYDVNDNMIASLPITAPSCDWAWNGWDAGTGTKFAHVLIYANDPYNGGALMQMDDMEVDPAGEIPGIDMCQPGLGGVMTCPCGNPPASTPRGCNNSSNTGGALLTSSGQASLGNDSLQFICTGEKPTASSILLQGHTPPLPTGAKFGQGVRCISAGLKRLYVHTALGGSVAYPQGNDLAVSEQSAAKGDTITAGSTRLYMVYYRDPTVLGSCTPLVDTFNASQSQSVLWSQ
jgi:hypothetical protein